MANTIGWGKATQNNDNGFGKYQNTIGAASIYAESYAGETAVVGTSAAYSSTRSFSFDGIDGYFDLGTISALNGGITAFSTSMWINYSGSLAADMLLSGGTSISDDFYIQLKGSTKLRYASGAQFDDITISSISAGTWYHIATVHNGTNIDVYLDGTLQGNATTQTPTNSIGTNLVLADYLLTGSGFNYAGNIDEVSIWDSALSSDAITEIASGPNDLESLTNASSSNLVAWYKMGE